MEDFLLIMHFWFGGVLPKAGDRVLKADGMVLTMASWQCLGV